MQLTGLRAYLAAWVILYHADLFWYLHLPHGFFYSFLHPFLFKGYLAVDVFFVLSGFVLMAAYQDRLQTFKDYLKMLWSRLSRLYPIYILTLLLPLIIEPLVHANTDYSYWTVFLNAIMIQNWSIIGNGAPSINFVSWSVSLEWFASIFLTPLLSLSIIRFSANKKILISSILMVVLIILSLTYYPLGYPKLLEIHLGWGSLVRAATEFGIGGLFYSLYKNYNTFLKKWALLFFLGGLFIVLLASLGPYGDCLIVPGSLMLISALTSGCALSKKIMTNRVALLLGKASYSIYLVQTIVLLIMSRIIHFRVFTHMYVVAAILLFATIALGLLFYYTIEKPARKKLKAIFIP